MDIQTKFCCFDEEELVVYWYVFRCGPIWPSKMVNKLTYVIWTVSAVYRRLNRLWYKSNFEMAGLELKLCKVSMNMVSRIVILFSHNWFILKQKQILHTLNICTFLGGPKKVDKQCNQRAFVVGRTKERGVRGGHQCWVGRLGMRGEGRGVVITHNHRKVAR